MSGICGAVSFDDGPPAHVDIASMLGHLQRRGPDGTGAWRGECVALGHALLATTHEASDESLPLRHPESGCVITADARIDNRDELIAALGLQAAGRAFGDGELILLAYLKWGEECPALLLGDFAFAIWNPRRSRLFCARDQMGMRQLAYAELPGRGLVFATEPNAIVRHPLVEKKVNVSRVADYLDGLEGWDLVSTFFQGVLRLPPAHVLKADCNGLSIERYWDLQSEPELMLGSDEEYGEAFLDVFEEAVRCRLRGGPVGCMLSGGIDSGSVASIAASLSQDLGIGPLRTFSATGPTRDSAETRSIYASMEQIPGILPSAISYANLGDRLVDLVLQTKESADPFDAEMTLIRAVYMLARDAGVKIVLDGVSADVVLASSSLIAGLLRHGRIGQAIREARGEEAFWGKSFPAWSTLAKGAWHAYIPRLVREAKRRISGKLADRALLSEGLVQPAFAERIGFVERRRRWRKQMATSRTLDPRERLAWIVDGSLIAARERYDRVASDAGIEPRDPFIDLRMIRFCLSLPWAQLQRCGYPKFILRRAMRGRLPAYVLWRPGREHHGLDFTWAMFSGDSAFCSSVERRRETIEEFVVLDRAVRGRDGPIDSDQFLDWLTTIYLANWFESNAGCMGRRSCPRG